MLCTVDFRPLKSVPKVITKSVYVICLDYYYLLFFFFKKYVYDKELRTRGTLTASRVFENNWRSRIHVMRRDPMATRIIRSFLMFSVYMNRIVLLLSLKVPAKFVVNSFSCFCIYKSKLLSIFKNKQRVLV